MVDMGLSIDGVPDLLQRDVMEWQMCYKEK